MFQTIKQEVTNGRGQRRFVEKILSLGEVETKRMLMRKRYLEPKVGYLNFFKDAFPHAVKGASALKMNFHIEYIAMRLYEYGIRIKNREPKLSDLIINVCPAESKSLLVTKIFPAWLWAIDPRIVVISGSYDEKLSHIISRETLDLIRSEWFVSLYGHQWTIRKDLKGKREYGTTKGGKRYSTSSGSSITGVHAHAILIDDPINPKALESLNLVEKANKWMSETLIDRKIDQEVTPIILIQQRISYDDQTALMLSENWGSKVEHICLPAEDLGYGDVKPAFLAKHYTEGIMNPHRHPRKALESLEKLQVSYAAQYLQVPRKQGNELIKPSSFKYFSLGKFIAEHPEAVWHATIDGAYTRESKNDQTAGMFFAVVDGYFYFRSCFAKWWNVPDLMTNFGGLADANGLNNQNSMVGVESKATHDLLKEKYPEYNVFEIKQPASTKIARVSGMLVPKLFTDRIHLCEEHDWSYFLQQASQFPFVSRDDLVDAMTMAIEHEEMIKNVMLESVNDIGVDEDTLVELQQINPALVAEMMEEYNVSSVRELAMAM